MTRPPITQSDRHAAEHLHGMWTATEHELDDLIKAHHTQPFFTSRVTAEAARQVREFRFNRRRHAV